MSRPVVLAVLFLMTACEAHLSVGEPCARNTDCEDPLVCLLGRCRVECLADRDCDPGLHCVEANDDLGVCTVPPEEDCNGGCPTPLTCEDGRCRNECTLTEQCLTGAECDEGVCVFRPDLPDAGARDASAGDAGDAIPLQPCNADDQCPSGLVCAIELGVSWCTRECTTHEDCAELDPDRTCDRYSSPRMFYGCTLACIPGTSIGCPPASTCMSADNASGLADGPSGLTICRADGTGTDAEGCPCADGSVGSTCADGLTCRTESEPFYTCARQCAIGGDDCGPGIACQRATAMSVIVDRVEYGLCAPPMEPPTGCSMPPP